MSKHTKHTYYICCITCHQPLWVQVSNVVDKNLASHNTKPMGRNQTKLTKQLIDCPLCKRPYFRSINEGKDRTIEVRDKTGKAFVI